MTSPAESVEVKEVIEVNWNIPNFPQSTIPNSDGRTYSRKSFFVGGGVPTLPVKLDASFINVTRCTKTYHIVFRLSSDKSKFPSSSVLIGKLLDLKIVYGERPINGAHIGDLTKPMDFLKTSHHDAEAFSESELKSHMDKKGDGTLKIYFKMEVTHNLPMMPNTATTLNGGVAVSLDNFESVLMDSRNADVEIKVSQGRGVTFRCHKAVLAARSPIFFAMFKSDMKERKEDVVEVDDILPKTMEHFIYFLYTGRFQDSSWIQSLPQLTYASDKYCVESLKELCDLNLIQSATFRNALTLGKLAERHGLTKAAENIRDFMGKYKKEVTLDTEVEIFDANFQVRYRVPYYFEKTVLTATKNPKNALPNNTATKTRRATYPKQL